MGRHSDGGTHTSAAWVPSHEQIDDAMRRCDCCSDVLGDGKWDCHEDSCGEEGRRGRS